MKKHKNDKEAHKAFMRAAEKARKKQQKEQQFSEGVFTLGVELSKIYLPQT